MMLKVLLEPIAGGIATPIIQPHGQLSLAVTLNEINHSMPSLGADGSR